MTPAQLATLKTYIDGQGDLSTVPNNDDGFVTVANKLNLLASPDVFVWRTDAPVNDIFDAITWANYTPVDAADNTVTYSNRLLLIQTKQMNLQNMLIGRGSIDASKQNVRAGLRDALINLPAGAGGAAISAGGASAVTVMTACIRKARRAESVLITSTPTTGGVTAGVMGFEGVVTPSDVQQARNP